MTKKSEKTLNTISKALEKLSDEELSALQFTVPWQYDVGSDGYKDPDDFYSSRDRNKTNTKEPDKREDLQRECWQKFNVNPHVNTSVRGVVGRLTGSGFEVSSEVKEIQDVLTEIDFDQRNRLYNFWPKYVARSFIEGELFLCLSVHEDGFVEIDFIDPALITSGSNNDGIITHPFKTNLPLIYCIKTANKGEIQIPSIYIARYPDLLADAAKEVGYDDTKLDWCRTGKKKYSTIGGFTKFIVAWDRSFLSKRNVSYLRTILEWLNHYETLKKYEIDHKKSSGAYLWVVTITEPKVFRMWLSLSDEEKRKTGIMAKKTPGGTLVLPLGMEMDVKNPQLPKISDSDTDILHMVTSGLNEPEDISTGQAKGTFASVKMSRGPLYDRISDEMAYFERFLKHDFYGNIFFLKTAVSDFPEIFKIREAVDFKDGIPIYENIKKRPEFLVDITFPNSEMIDTEGKARTFLGVKHGSTNDVLGIPNSIITKKLGIGGTYRKLRLQQATETKDYPALVPAAGQVDATSPTASPTKPPLIVKRNKKAIKPGG